jgi:hypothetical protein
MATQTFDAITQSSDTGTEVLAILDSRTDTLRACFVGPSGPSSPVVGQFWLNDTTTPLVLSQWGDHDGTGAAWNEVLITAAISSDMTLNYNEILEGRMANLAGHPSVSAGRDGHLYILTGDGELYFIDQAVDGVTKKVCAVTVGTTTDRVQMPMSDVGLGGTPPTLKTKGTTPAVIGWEFDATGELYSWNVRVPLNFSADGDLNLNLSCVLDQAETANDDIDWSADVLSLADGESTTGTSTAAAASLTDIGANNAEGDLTLCTIVIDYDDATNPVVAGDLLHIEIHRTNLTEVGGVIVTLAELVYPCKGPVQ